ncbi:P-loop containing nucleoside triphosphate hydrolase [Leadbetterella byssophila DSM 17132]|uniref:P-loop containing nucleoside triphosphate hydrolase n=1 Tax=Leadbetterella byssophila (strain DSM 17132 / JCM 16389 / KACC 11308 / NBRC 106382 / 4M15) TaxID=649349 RepID=E4RSV6_LEAB4|nr:AAA family ATPase [Leadbetterella byssophila]ADQ16795.1 P-loop containing nucleoside triphosphate hydrolase [Leadbetterella byssophila DSM 17132]
MKNLFVITGGPGAGKTTLLNALSANGYKTIPEAARTIIREETALNGDALPWKNKQLYTDKMIAASLLDYNRAKASQSYEVCFFDRGILAAVCYADMIGYVLSTETIEKVLNCSYYPKVFILPPWKEIYQTDNERKQDWQEAVHTYFQMKSTYEKHGYEVINVPIGNINERKEFVLTQIR